MEAYKNLIKNIVLILAMGAIPPLCWASGLFSPFSWSSLFLLLSGVFILLWIKAYTTSQTLKTLLSLRGEAWAICDGDQIIDCSSNFPVRSLNNFSEFLHPASLPVIQAALASLIHEGTPFHKKVKSKAGDATYSLTSNFFENKILLSLKNISASVQQDYLHQKTLQKRELIIESLKSCLDLLPMPIWLRDEHQKITYCNGAYKNAVQASSLQEIYEEGIELIQSRTGHTLSRKALNTQDTQILEDVLIAEGDRRHFRLYEIPDKQGLGTLGLAVDISEIQQLKAEKFGLMKAHNEVLDHLSTAISVHDAEGILQYYNQAYVKLHDFDENFLKTSPHLDEVLENLRSRRQLPEHADFPAYKKQCLLKLHEQIEPQEDLLHLPDERTIRIFSAPHPLGGLLFMFEDVTNYLTLERKNKSLLEAYQTTLDNLFEGIVVIGSDNRLKFFNPSFLHLWNFEGNPDIAPGQHLTNLINKLKNIFTYDGEWEIYKAKIIDNLTDRIPKTGQLKQRNGTIINFGYIPLPNGDHLLSYTDATDASRVQEALQEKNEALEMADHLKSEFIANVSTELRSPLNTIIGFIEIILQQYFGELNERQIDYANGILESSNKLLNLVNDILDLASIEAGHLTLDPHEAHIPTLIETVISLVSKRAELKRLQILFKCDRSVQKWIVDERRLKQALFNLLSNSIKFTPSSGKITIEAMLHSDELEIAISDTGVGIPLEDQERLFKKFERGKEKQQLGIGVGLGLSLVKSLIELHGGYINLFSEPERGTKVSCFLPRTPKRDSDNDNGPSSKYAQTRLA